MADTDLFGNLILVLVAAAIGGLVAMLLRQPLILGYLAGGIFLSPFTPGPEANFDEFRFLTEIGVGLLLFVLGSNLSPARFRGIGRVVVAGGVLHVAISVGLGLALTPALGLGLVHGLFLGVVLAQSSSAVISKIMVDRREADSEHGNVAVGISVVQDLTSFPLLLIVLAFIDGTPETPTGVLIAIGQVFGLAAATYALGRIVWPWVLDFVHRFNSNETTLLTTVALVMGAGLAMQSIGLSFALGAFLAGIVVSQSAGRSSAVSSVLPLRDVLVALFFVSIGTLFNPAVIWEQTEPLAYVLGVLVVGKALGGFIILRVIGLSASVSVFAAVLLAQIGEFAFILSSIGVDRGAMSEELFSVVIAAAVISILVNSLVLDSAPPVLAYLARVTRFRPLAKQSEQAFSYLRMLRRQGTADRLDKESEVEPD